LSRWSSSPCVKALPEIVDPLVLLAVAPFLISLHLIKLGLDAANRRIVVQSQLNERANPDHNDRTRDAHKPVNEARSISIPVDDSHISPRESAGAVLA
jgi:hypothetical protein